MDFVARSSASNLVSGHCGGPQPDAVIASLYQMQSNWEEKDILKHFEKHIFLEHFQVGFFSLSCSLSMLNRINISYSVVLDAGQFA